MNHRLVVAVFLGLVCVASAATVSTRVRVLATAEDELAVPDYTPEIVDDKGAVVTKRCFRCNISKVMEPDDANVQTIWTAKDYEEFRKNPAERTANILKLLGDIRKVPRHGTAKDIEQMEHLLGLYRVLKKELIHHLKQNHVPVPELPSEEASHSYVDASGAHWGDAEMRDSLQELMDERDAQIRKEKEKLANATAKAIKDEGADNTKFVDGGKSPAGKVDRVHTGKKSADKPSPVVTSASVGDCKCMRKTHCPCRDTRSMVSQDAIHSGQTATVVGGVVQSTTASQPNQATPGNGIDIGIPTPQAPKGTPVGFSGEHRTSGYQVVKSFPKGRLPGSPELDAALKKEQARVALEKSLTENRLMATPQCPCGCPIDECPCRCKKSHFLVPSDPHKTPVRFESVKPSTPPSPNAKLPSNRVVVEHKKDTKDCVAPLCFSG